MSEAVAARMRLRSRRGCQPPPPSGPEAHSASPSHLTSTRRPLPPRDGVGGSGGPAACAPADPRQQGPDAQAPCRRARKHSLPPSEAIAAPLRQATSSVIRGNTILTAARPNVDVQPVLVPSAQPAARGRAAEAGAATWSSRLLEPPDARALTPLREGPRDAHRLAGRAGLPHPQVLLVCSSAHLKAHSQRLSLL
ncbi:hypothetical protein C7M84_002713 [Penaeus vannamei]|uniref:Uncharacterized protein n=1 Tax=Penaeus vannamei TaxID=6689 RepID=A0A3R7PVS4_PENVA|nr:hypothetical protein C7M84_002713 [Penaeus vannamei]